MRMMFRRSSRNIILLVGLLAVSSGLSTYVAADQNATVRASATLDEHWRGTYDILVRPKDAVQATEREHGVVESNYLSAASSGITVQQWKAIEKIGGVEVAAPVSTIGYLRNAYGRITLDVPPQTESSLYKFSMVVTSTNGYRDVGLHQYEKYLLIGSSSITNATTSQALDALVRDVDLVNVGVGAIMPDGSVNAWVATPPIIWTLVAGIDPSAERRLTGLDAAIVERRYLPDNDGVTTAKVGETYWGDKADALDRHQDAANGRINPDGPDLPIISASSTYAALPATVQVDKLEMLSDEELSVLRETMQQAYLEANSPDYVPVPGQLPHVEAQQEFLENLGRPVLQRLVDTFFDLGSVLRPMSERPLNISIYPGKSPLQTDAEVVQGESKGLEKSYSPGSVTYEPHSANFATDGMLTLAAVPKMDSQTIISLTGETAFRSLSPSTPAMLKPGWDANIKARNKSPYTFHEIGSYDLSKLPASITNPDPLTYVPLGIYQPPLVSLVRDANGDPLPGGPVPLRPTINPASFIPGPPLAFTNIAGACFFRGESCIDAIRVRVAGIDQYTPQNVRKVEEVAQRIIQSTGLHVDIVAGSSPQKVLVYIPGSPDGTVPPLGYVEEPWTTLGAAAAISSGIDQASISMLAAVGIAGLLYLMGQSLLSTLALRRELALLGAVGWRRRHISLLVLGEAAVLGLLGGLCATVLAVLIAAGLGLAAPISQALLVGLAVLLLYVLASIGPSLWIVRQPVAELLQRGEVALPVRGPRSFSTVLSGLRFTRQKEKAGSIPFGGAGLRSLTLFAWRNLLRRRVRTLLAVGSIAIASTLLMLLFAALLALGGTLQVTLLGQFMNLQVQPYHLIMVGSALSVGVLAVADHLAMGVLERRHELALLQAIGWRKAAVQWSILLEGLLIGLIGGLVGLVVTVVAAVFSRSELILQAWWILPLSLLAVLLLCSLSAIYAMLLTPRRAPMRVLN